MFCLIYFSDIPHVLEISQNKSTLTDRLVEKSIQQCIDEAGRKNFVNTLEKSENLIDIVYPVYPNFALKKHSDEKIEVYKIEKKQIIEKGYIYNSTKDIVESSLVGTYYIVPVENWKFDDLPQRPLEEPRLLIKPFHSPNYQIATHLRSRVKTSSECSTSGNSNLPVAGPSVNYDKVLLELIESIQKRKID